MRLTRHRVQARKDEILEPLSAPVSCDLTELRRKARLATSLLRVCRGLRGTERLMQMNALRGRDAVSFLSDQGGTLYHRT
jgi:hypothetical protein